MKTGMILINCYLPRKDLPRKKGKIYKLPNSDKKWYHSGLYIYENENILLTLTPTHLTIFEKKKILEMYILIDTISKRNVNSATTIKKNTVYYLNPSQKEDCFTKNIISNTEERNKANQ